MNSYSEILSHLCPLIIIIVCYSIIWGQIWSQDKYLKEVGNNDIKKMIAKREIQFAKTFFMVVLAYFISVVPIRLLNLIDRQILARHPNLLRVFSYCWYLQYSLNCLIYAIKSEQYRKAYSYLFQQVSNLR